MFRKMSSFAIRNDLKLIYETAVSSVKTDNLIKNCISINKNELIVKDRTDLTEKRFPLNNREIYLIGSGKAVLKMCEEFLRHIDKVNSESNNTIKVNSGVLSVPIGSIGDDSILNKYNVKYYSGAKNNMPDESAQKTTVEIINLIESAKSNSLKMPHIIPLLITFISGGGSALLTCPKPPLTLNEKCSVISRLVQSGATIEELNKVRRCLSLVKCGKLTQLAIDKSNSVELISFIISDIIGDPIELIASGPTVCTDTNGSGREAIRILRKHNIEIEDKVKCLIMDEENLPQFESHNRLSNIIIGNNMVALESAREKAIQMGYYVLFMGNDIRGEASERGREFAEIGMKFKDDMKNYKGMCWLWGGETTVNMKNISNNEIEQFGTSFKSLQPHGHVPNLLENLNIGIGGRCQEMGLAFYRALHCFKTDKLYFLAAGTDGQDGPTPVSGCIVENVTFNKENEEIYEKSKHYLENHDSHNFWKSYYNQWLIGNGPTGTNVMDIYAMIKCRET